MIVEAIQVKENDQEMKRKKWKASIQMNRGNNTITRFHPQNK
jgi:hypothetical protein